MWEERVTVRRCGGVQKEGQRTCPAPWHAYAGFNPQLPGAGRASSSPNPSPRTPEPPSPVSPAAPNPNAVPGDARLPPGGGGRGGAGGRTPRTSPSQPRWQSTSSAGSWCPCQGLTRRGEAAGADPCPGHARTSGRTQPCAGRNKLRGPDSAPGVPSPGHGAVRQ